MDCQAHKLNKEDAMDCSRWKKLIKDVWWSGWVWVGECFFWYRPTQVVPDKGPLNGCACVCVCVCACVRMRACMHLCFCLFYAPFLLHVSKYSYARYIVTDYNHQTDITSVQFRDSCFLIPNILMKVPWGHSHRGMTRVSLYYHSVE